MANAIETLHNLLVDCYKYSSKNIDINALKETLGSLSSEQVYGLLLARDSTCDTILHWITCRGNIEVLRCLLGSLMPDQIFQLLKLQDKEGRTTLHITAYLGHLEIAVCQLDCLTTEQKYNILLSETNDNYTAVHRAAFWGHSSLLQYFLCSFSSEQVYNLLIRQTDAGRTALHLCSLKGNLNCLEVILNQKLPDRRLLQLLLVQTNVGQTAEQLAFERRFSEVFSCLQGCWRRLSETSTNRADNESELSKLIVSKYNVINYIYDNVIKRDTN